MKNRKENRIMRKVVLWEAENGRLFYDREECILYEILSVTDGKMSDGFSFRDDDGNEIDIIQVIKDMHYKNPHDSTILFKALNFVQGITLSDYRDVRVMKMLKEYWGISLPEEIGVWYWSKINNEWIKKEKNQ